MNPNWIKIQPNQKITYIVNGTFPYHVQLGQNSQVIMKSKNPNQQVVINGNIWGPGNFTLDCKGKLIGDLNIAPASNVLTSQCYLHTKNEMAIEINEYNPQNMIEVEINEHNPQKMIFWIGKIEVLQGDWVLCEEENKYYHHSIYVGNLQFVSNRTNGVVLENFVKKDGQNWWIVKRCGQQAADQAKQRIGENSYNLIINNSEHFCSSVCGLGQKADQVKIQNKQMTTSIISGL